MKFEDQKHQTDCSDNIAEIFEKIKTTDGLDASNFEQVIKAFHNKKSIPVGDTSKSLRVDVLMETGTGKTFTYIDAMYKLNQKYNKNKFIVFVPRLAIREGVIQNIKLSEGYFNIKYQRQRKQLKRLKIHSYDGKGNTGQVRDYIRNKDELSVLILTGSSIVSKKSEQRNLTKPYEGLGFEDKSLIGAISKLKPVVFIDEPHLLKGEAFVKVYQEYFSESFCVRFGATFPVEEVHKLSNVVYVLDSLTSFRKQLVKKINVYQFSRSSSYVKFLQKISNKRSVEIAYRENNNECRKVVEYGENLGVGNYKDVHIVRVRGDKVYLSNGEDHELSGNYYQLSKDSLRDMVKKTIELHFAKEEELFKEGIKTLSLFFIPRKHDFRGDEPRIKNIFDAEYKKIRCEILNKKLHPDYRNYLEQDYNSEGKLLVREGYFAGDKGSKDEIEARAVNDILKDKTNLLSLAKPLRFIFSVWALQEGWDNPNIFNLCKLAPTRKDTSRRQQVGRGLRLAVNEDGARINFERCNENEEEFYKINSLDVVVASEEGEFIEDMQKEINSSSYCLDGNFLHPDMLRKWGLNREECRLLISFLIDNKVIVYSESRDNYSIEEPIVDFLKENKKKLIDIVGDKYHSLIDGLATSDGVENYVFDGNKSREMIGIRREKFAEFEELWKTITTKVKLVYKKIDESSVIKEVVKSFDTESIDKVRITIEKKSFDHVKNEVVRQSPDTITEVDFFKRERSYEDFIFNFIKREKLPLPFVLKMFNGLDRKKIENDPEKARAHIERKTKDAIHKSVVQSIGYDFGDAFENEVAISTNEKENKIRGVFYDAAGKPLLKIERGKIGRYSGTEQPSPSFLYDKIVYDSSIEKETIIKNWEGVDNSRITVFAKLPRIVIPTPYKSYSPDFAYFIEHNGGRKLFMVVECKGYDSIEEIPDEQLRKMEYGKKFFEQINKKTKGSIEVKFERVINKTEFTTLISRIVGEPRVA